MRGLPVGHAASVPRDHSSPPGGFGHGRPIRGAALVCQGTDAFPEPTPGGASLPSSRPDASQAHRSFGDRVRRRRLRASLIACVRQRGVERVLPGEGFVRLGVFEGHVVFENPDRLRYCSINVPNPMETFAEDLQHAGDAPHQLDDDDKEPDEAEHQHRDPQPVLEVAQHIPALLHLVTAHAGAVVNGSVLPTGSSAVGNGSAGRADPWCTAGPRPREARPDDREPVSRVRGNRPPPCGVSRPVWPPGYGTGQNRWPAINRFPSVRTSHDRRRPGYRPQP